MKLRFNGSYLTEVRSNVALLALFCASVGTSFSLLASTANMEAGHSHHSTKQLIEPQVIQHDQASDSTAKLSPDVSTGHRASLFLSKASVDLAKIRVAPLTAKRHQQTLRVPAEIKANGYTSYLVSPRTESVIVQRHVVLGQHLEVGQALVTLFSETVAEAQANYQIALSEWRRTQNLAEQTISESRKHAISAQYQASLGRLVALGLTPAAIQALAADSSEPLGEYTLAAQGVGVVMTDEFVLGQRVEAGQAIIQVADERLLWVEARLPPNLKLELPFGTRTNVLLDGYSYPSQVIQSAHKIDPITRTRIVRLSVENPDDRLHSGMFVSAELPLTLPEPVLAVPETALIRNPDGDWSVFIETTAGMFQALEVEIGRELGEFREISGVRENTRIVTQGAFFMASELAKGGFDPHNH